MSLRAAARQLGVDAVTELAAPFHMSQPAISKHLKVLERAGLISGRRFWEERFQRLDTLLDELKSTEEQQS